jgi:hypothetical protein
MVRGTERQSLDRHGGVIAATVIPAKRKIKWVALSG